MIPPDREKDITAANGVLNSIIKHMSSLKTPILIGINPEYPNDYDIVVLIGSREIFVNKRREFKTLCHAFLSTRYYEKL